VSGLLPALGGGASSAVQLVAGGLSGVVTMSALIVSGVVPAGPPPVVARTLAVVGCPGAGSIVAVAQPGQQMLVTGRSADGAWLRIYVPGPASNDGWVPATSVNVLADASGLPVAGCAEVAAATGTPGPTATATVLATATPTPAATPTATPKPTSTPRPTPTPTPVPTPTPNLGPTFVMQPVSDVASINTNPLGTGTCTLALGTGLTTRVSDPDGIAGIQLWVRKPGAATYKRLSHDFTNNGGTWNDFINAKDDGVTTAGTLSYYALATDTKGAKTKSKTRSLKIVRCDTEAQIGGGLNLYQDAPKQYRITLACGAPDNQPLPWRLSVVDPDGLRSVKVSYVLAQTSGSKTSSGSVTLVDQGGGIWTGSSASYYLWDWYGINSLQWSVVTTDAYGGKSSYAETDSLRISAC
jgi:hypothetical protein